MYRSCSVRRCSSGCRKAVSSEYIKGFLSFRCATVHFLQSCDRRLERALWNSTTHQCGPGGILKLVYSGQTGWCKHNSSAFSLKCWLHKSDKTGNDAAGWLIVKASGDTCCHHHRLKMGLDCEVMADLSHTRGNSIKQQNIHLKLLLSTASPSVCVYVCVSPGCCAWLAEYIDKDRLALLALYYCSCTSPWTVCSRIHIHHTVEIKIRRINKICPES